MGPLSQGHKKQGCNSQLDSCMSQEVHRGGPQPNSRRSIIIMSDSSGLGNGGSETHCGSPRIKLNFCVDETSQLVVGGKQTDCLWLWVPLN